MGQWEGGGEASHGTHGTARHNKGFARRGLRPGRAGQTGGRGRWCVRAEEIKRSELRTSKGCMIINITLNFLNFLKFQNKANF